ncbi:hypothetical protein F2Q70_00001232 [Brassica cretica]|uniref:Uncharacterized protein n=1 Tax=Brassica cretica TaxID=69181 RepID=A0A8S9IQG1_BRACR|nr:hypothetical protein F2Q70_00001232 [Brassica cretica]
MAATKVVFQIWKTSGLEDFQMTSRKPSRRLPGSLPTESSLMSPFHNRSERFGRVQSGTGRKRDGSKTGRVESGMGLTCGILKARNPKSSFLLSPKTLREREREKAIRRYVAPVMVVSGSMMLPVSQAPSFCTCGASSSHHKKFENSLSTEEEDLVPAMGSS